MVSDKETNEKRLKNYWYRLIGKELYVYRAKDSNKHKILHSLVGAYIKNEADVKIDGATLYSFKLIFPSKTVRQYYSMNQAQKDEWMMAFKQAIGYTNIFDYYDIK